MNLRVLSRALRLLPPVMAAAMPQVVSAESLADAVAMAYAHNPTLVQQRFTQKSVDENYVQARAQYGPQLSLQATGNYDSQNALGSTSSSSTGQVIAQVSQPIYTSGQLRGQLRAAHANVLAGQQNLRQVEQNTVQNVIIVYAQVLRDEQRVQVARENVAVLQDQLRENRERYTKLGRGQGAGDVTLTDVGQADTRLAQAESDLASLEATLDTSRAQYLQIVGQNPGTLDPLPDLPGMPASIDEAFARAEANNPGLLTAKYTEQASSANAAAARGALGPTASLTVQGSYTSEPNQVIGRYGSKEVFAGVTVRQPLFSSGALRSQVRQADARNGADQAAVEAARRQVIESVDAAWSQLVAARRSLTSGERQVTSAQLAFAGMHREELYGLRSTIETLNAEQDLFSAQLNFLSSRYTEYVSRAQLLSAIGALKAEAIVTGLQKQDPNDNFRKVRNRGRTPLEPLAMAIDRIGSANPRRPAVADLAGADSPLPNSTAPLPDTPSAEVLQKPLVPITQSPLVPADKLPGGLPKTGDLPDKPAMSTDLNP
ncbi:TolC family outer membrane protein [Sphingomonas sp. PR090111-T3T-6A]|uniref:TolC family outer membrane protein n=1 Tax=Sphingomonas sp. PR090111-T3T-6A TaxID=685778 RepID=UPI0003774264|nr:TolC family outer membrane protein [Sphingomonas sp. PR090111-T3T-6A]